MVGVIIACVALALDLSDGWVLSLGIVISFGIMLSSGVFNVPEEKEHHRRIIINGNTNANGNYRLSA